METDLGLEVCCLGHVLERKLDAAHGLVRLRAAVESLDQRRGCVQRSRAVLDDSRILLLQATEGSSGKRKG